MKRVVVGMMLFNLALLGGGRNVNAATAPRDGDSLEYRLSCVFSEMYPTNGQGLALRMMDRDLPFSYGRPDADARDFHIATGGELLVVRLGHRLCFHLGDGAGYLSVAVTNATAGVDAVSECRRPDGQFILLDWNSVVCRNPRRVSVERFVVDVAGARCHDVQSGTWRSMEMPFRSIWKDWDDYMENHSGISSWKRAEDFRLSAQGMYRRLVECRTFQEYCRALGDDLPHAVLCQWKSVSGPGESILALVQRGRGKGTIVAAATFGSGCMCNVLCAFREDGSVRQHSVYWNGPGGGMENHYEFDDAGRLGRFVELDGKGREQLRRNRFIRKGEMVPPHDRTAFLNEVRGALHPLHEAWLLRSYDVVECFPPQPDAMRRNEDAGTGALLRELHADRQSKVDAMNSRRRSAGLPDMTETEKALLLRDDALDKSRLEFERLRHESTGLFSTTDVDRIVDQERARLRYLARTVSRRYPIAVNKSGARPETLRALLEVRIPPHGVPLLPGGEKDIIDSWGREYRYGFDANAQEAGGPRPVIISAGCDGIFDTDDDVGSDDKARLVKEARGRE